MPTTCGPSWGKRSPDRPSWQGRLRRMGPRPRQVAPRGRRCEEGGSLANQGILCPPPEKSDFSRERCVSCLR